MRFLRNPKQWNDFVRKNLVAGYVAGSDKSQFSRNALVLYSRLVDHLGLVDKTLIDMRILDIGCANGRLPISMDIMRVPIESYLGVDVMNEVVLFCRDAFSGSDVHEFRHVAINNARYAPRQTLVCADLEIDGEFDVIVANSLFTHLGDISNAVAYLSLMKSHVADRGIVYTTWFCSPPNVVSDDTKKTVYRRDDILKIIDDAGFSVELSDTSLPQWIVALSKK